MADGISCVATLALMLVLCSAEGPPLLTRGSRFKKLSSDVLMSAGGVLAIGRPQVAGTAVAEVVAWVRGFR